MSKKIIVCCKLPNGIILDHPLDPNQKVTLNGLNQSIIVGADYATTEVDAEFWETWKTVHKDFGPVLSGAIFEAKTTEEAKSKAKERASEKTGFEKMPQEAQGVKPTDKE